MHNMICPAHALVAILLLLFLLVLPRAIVANLTCDRNFYNFAQPYVQVEVPDDIRTQDATEAWCITKNAGYGVFYQRHHGGGAMCMTLTAPPRNIHCVFRGAVPYLLLGPFHHIKFKLFVLLMFGLLWCTLYVGTQ